MKSTRTLVRASMALLMLGSALGGCRPAATERPDVLLVTIDTLRADHCSSYGYGIQTTPHLDRLAARGTLFLKAYAESATTAPSHAVLMTGRHFRTLGVRKNADPLGEEAVTLAEQMRTAGYETAAFVSSFPLQVKFGFAQGFDVYDDEFTLDEASIGRRKPGSTPHDRYAGATLQHVQRWLASRRDTRPLFMWVHFVDPHSPYKAPETFAGRWAPGTGKVIRNYDQEVHYADEQLGHLLEIFAKSTQPRSDLVVVTSDHGEGLGDHRWMSHGINLYEEAVRIPLVFAWKGRVPEGAVVDDPVALIDVPGAIAELAGVDSSTFEHGGALFQGRDPRRTIYLQRRDYSSRQEHGRKISGDMSAVVQGGSKLILAPGEDRREFYSLTSDPHELEDLLLKRRAPVVSAVPDEVRAAAPDKAHTLEESIAKWHAEVPEAVLSDEPIDKETLKALRSLGYVD